MACDMLNRLESKVGAGIQSTVLSLLRFELLQRSALKNLSRQVREIVTPARAATAFRLVGHTR